MTVMTTLSRVARRAMVSGVFFAGRETREKR
jgi:hypothetical protein